MLVVIGISHGLFHPLNVLFFMVFFMCENGVNLLVDFKDLPKINPFEDIYKQKRGNLIKTIALKKLWKEAKQILHGVDYLRFISSDKEAMEELRALPLFSSEINWTNSSEINIEWYNPFYYDNDWKIQYLSVWKILLKKEIETSSWEKFVVYLPYEDLTVPVLEFNFYYWEERKDGGLKTWWMIEFKGKPFRLEAISCGAFNPYEFLKGLLLSEYSSSYGVWDLYFNTLEDSFDILIARLLSTFRITRIDYRFDFFMPKWHFGIKDYEVFSKIRGSNLQYTCKEFEKKLNACPYGVRNKSWRHYTWRTCGSYSEKTKKDSNYLKARFYQKQVDTWCKGWSELYPEYMNFNWEVWRLEFQFESKFCNARTTAWERFWFYEEFEEKQLTKQIFEFLGIAPKTWLFCQPKLKKQELDLNKQPYSYQKRMITRYMNDTRRFTDNGFNPYEIIDMALTVEQIEKLKSLKSRDKILNAFASEITKWIFRTVWTGVNAWKIDI